MIELNKKTQQDFLGREWVQRLLGAGVDMSDAKYCLVQDNLFKRHEQDKVYVALRKNADKSDFFEDNYSVLCSTYTVSELLYKLHERLGKFAPICGSIDIMSPSSFVCSVDEDNCHEMLFSTYGDRFQSYIEQLASLLIQCHKKDIVIKSKDTGDISDK